MPDDVDNTNQKTQFFDSKIIKRIREKSEIKPGKPGDCDLCGEYTVRLIGGACVACRNKYKLP
jgi:hypothetical protein